MAAKRAAKDASFEVILDFGNSWSDKGEHHKRNDARSLFNLRTKQFPSSGGTIMLSGGVKLTIVFHILNCDHDAAKQKHVAQGNTEQTELLAAAIIRSNWIL